MSDKCGTYAGYQAHLKKSGDQPCDACREASKLYARDRRARYPQSRDRELRLSKAQNRALWRLSREQPGRFRELVQEEMAVLRLLCEPVADESEAP